MKEIAKAITILVITFLPFAYHLIDRGIGQQDISGKLRGLGMVCWQDECGCTIDEKPGDGKGLAVVYECPIQTYGIGIYFFWGIFTAFASFCYQLLTQKNLNENSIKFFMAVLVFWPVAWIVLSYAFSIPVVFDEPKNGDWLIFSSVIPFFFGFYPWFIQAFIFVVMGNIAAVIGFFGLGFAWLLHYLAEKLIRRFKRV